MLPTNVHIIFSPTIFKLIIDMFCSCCIVIRWCRVLCQWWNETQNGQGWDKSQICVFMYCDLWMFLQQNEINRSVWLTNCTSIGISGYSNGLVLMAPVIIYVAIWSGCLVSWQWCNLILMYVPWKWYFMSMSLSWNCRNLMWMSLLRFHSSFFAAVHAIEKFWLDFFFIPMYYPLSWLWGLVLLCRNFFIGMYIHLKKRKKFDMF